MQSQLVELRDALQLALETNERIVQFFCLSGCMVTQGEFLNFEIRLSDGQVVLARMQDYESVEGPVRTLIMDEEAMDTALVASYRSALLSVVVIPKDLVVAGSRVYFKWLQSVLLPFGYLLDPEGNPEEGYEIVDAKGHKVGVVTREEDVAVIIAEPNPGGRALTKKVESLVR